MLDVEKAGPFGISKIAEVNQMNDRVSLLSIIMVFFQQVCALFLCPMS